MLLRAHPVPWPQEELSELAATEEPAGSSPMHQRLCRLHGLVGKSCNRPQMAKMALPFP